MKVTEKLLKHYRFGGHMKKALTIFTLILVLGLANGAQAITINPMDSGTGLVNNILGSGITVDNVSYTGATGASGYFSDGGAIGMSSGIILTSGSAAGAVGPNNNGSYSVDNGVPGDSALDALIPGSTTDATVLEFDFVSTGGSLYFNFVFASEEYNEWVGSQYNDVFGFFLDGVNIALIPGTSTTVAINNVNNGANSEYYNDNSNGLYDIEYDGFTDVFTATALGLTEGTHHIKLAIADAGDYFLDSAVFIQGGTFSDTPPSAVPVPAAVWLLGSGLAGLAGLRKKLS